MVGVGGGHVVRIGIISAYPDEDWHAQRIARAAGRCGQAEVLSPLDFAGEAGPGGARLTVRGEPHGRFALFLTPRAIGEQGDADLQLELYRTLAEEGALLVNDVRALTLAIDKFKTSWRLSRALLATPRARVVQRADAVEPALAALGGRAVAKPLFGSLGVGVERIDGAERGCALLASWGALYLQEFVDGGGRDVRAFVVGDRVCAAMARRAPPGEFRTNLHLGGDGEEVALDGRQAELAVQAARELGLDYAGVDLADGAAGPTVLEVNGTPLFRGIEEVTGRDVAGAIVAHALARAAQVKEA
jgi:ribosomal protein S6--L-glutamate ligase